MYVTAATRQPRRRRLRRVAKRTATVSGVLSLALWMTSGWASFRWERMSRIVLPPAYGVRTLEEHHLYLVYGASIRQGRLEWTWDRSAPTGAYFNEFDLKWVSRGSWPSWDPWLEFDEGGPGQAYAGLDPIPRQVVWPMEVKIPLWPLILALGMSAAYLCYHDRRRFAPGRCQRCGYDLAGLAPGAACPECGKGPRV